MATIKSYSDLEQSKKLAEILPLESADMTYCAITEDWQINVGLDIAIKENLFSYRNGYTVPCWSLAALLGVIPNYELISKHSYYTCIAETSFGKETVAWFDNPVDACYKLIIKLKGKNLL